MPEQSDTLFDKVIKRSQEINRGIVEKMVETVPRPPGQRKLTEREQLQRYQRLGPQEMMGLIQQRGRVEVEKYIADMERLRGKYGGR